MIRVCKYDGSRDLGESVPNLATCQRDIIESKVVPNICGVAEYNHFEEFNQFGGLVRDSFDAVEFRNAQGRFVVLHNSQSVENQ